MAAEKKWNFAKFNRPVKAEHGIQHPPEEIEAGIKQSEQALALAKELGGQDLIMQSRLLLAYCRLEQTGYQLISKLQDATLEGEAPAEPCEAKPLAERLAKKGDAMEKAAGEAFAQLKEALKTYVQARLDVMASFMPDGQVNLAKKAGAELESELDKVSVELAKKK